VRRALSLSRFGDVKYKADSHHSHHLAIKPSNFHPQLPDSQSISMNRQAPALMDHCHQDAKIYLFIL